MDIESKPSAASKVDLLQTESSRFLDLPPELLLVIIRQLSRRDQRTFCLLSQLSRQLALPVLFRRLTLRYSKNLERTIDEISQAREDVRVSIRELVLNGKTYVLWNYSILFRLLRSLPNLQRFRWSDFRNLSGLPQLIDSLQHCSLEHFTYWICHGLQGPVIAPPRLKSLSIKCLHVHVYDLIRPSFSTLVELEIFVIFFNRFVAFDLLPLTPVGRTLQKFVYKIDGFDPDILDVIPNVFPHLTTLELIVSNLSRDLNWKKSYDDAVSKNTKLQHLAVSAKNFTFCDNECWTTRTSCQACEDQRSQAACDLVIACTGLKCCRWDNSVGLYGFNISVSDGDTSRQVEIDPLVYRFKSFTHC